MRITRSMIAQKMRTLNSILKRPTEMWEPGVPSNQMNVGHLYLTSLGYGERLVEITSRSGGERAWSDVMSGNREIFDYLNGVMNGISLRNATLIIDNTPGATFQ